MANERAVPTILASIEATLALLGARLDALAATVADVARDGRDTQMAVLHTQQGVTEVRTLLRGPE